jgi:hypothetical protein
MIHGELLDASTNYRHKRPQDDAKATHLYDFVQHHSGLANKLARPFFLQLSSFKSER